MLNGKIRREIGRLTRAHVANGLVDGSVRKWLDAAWFGMYGRLTADATPRQRAEWWAKAHAVAEWASNQSDVRTFGQFLASARLTFREGERAVLFDFDGSPEPLYVAVTDRGYDVEAWGSCIETERLYMAAAFLYVEAVEEMCDGFRAWRN
jgi:hypothetical protein